MEDHMTEPNTNTAANTTAAKPIEEVVGEAIKASLAGFIQEGKAAQEAQETAKQDQAAADKAAADAAARGVDPFRQALEPHLDPMMKQVREAEVRAAMAADAATFYTDGKNASALPHREKIEALVTAQAKKGNVISRLDAWKYLRGGELYEPLQKEYTEAAAAKIKAAEEASTVSAGVYVGRPLPKPMGDMSTEELGKALHGVEF